MLQHAREKHGTNHDQVALRHRHCAHPIRPYTTCPTFDQRIDITNDLPREASIVTPEIDYRRRLALLVREMTIARQQAKKRSELL